MNLFSIRIMKFHEFGNQKAATQPERDSFQYTISSTQQMFAFDLSSMMIHKCLLLGIFLLLIK